MKFEIKKQDRETTLSLIRRFNKRIKQSSILSQARESRFYERTRSKNIKKRSALRGIAKRKEYQRQAKLGQTR